MQVVRAGARAGLIDQPRCRKAWTELRNLWIADHWRGGLDDNLMVDVVGTGELDAARKMAGISHLEYYKSTRAFNR